LGVDERSALRELKIELTRIMMSYKFATGEMMTKINILKEVFSSIHEYSPIEHVRSRLKSPEGIVKKALRTGCPLALNEIRDHIQDIAGIRITCSFISDTYRRFVAREDHGECGTACIDRGRDGIPGVETISRPGRSP
jgi:ppGpp synthetase/RelA/SpoT-type nucleotidyltranferase